MQLVSPCSSKPGGQEHTKLPRVFVQKWLHGSCHRWHSSISKEKENNVKNNKLVYKIIESSIINVNTYFCFILISGKTK